MSRKAMVVDIITKLVGNKITAEMIVERLTDEGFLVLGYGDADVDRIVQKFIDTYGTTKVTKQDRFAAHRLAAKYGSQSVCVIIGLLAANSEEKYVPVVGSVAQLEDKWVNVLSFIRNLKTDQPIDA